MQRYFVDKAQINNQLIKIEGNDVKHIVKVMRMSKGDPLICCEQLSGICYTCEVNTVDSEFVSVTILRELTSSSELPIKVSIMHGLPKSDKFDYIVQKGTELGAHAFIPYKAERSVVKLDHKKAEKRIERWSKIAKEASEQSHRSFIPAISDILSLHDAEAVFSSYSKIMVAYEEEAKVNERTNFKHVISNLKKNESLLLIVGPEGGFSTKEIKVFEKYGAVLCGLGPRILRTETAPLYVLSAVSYQFELLE